jgi:hypothetical protein
LQCCFNSEREKKATQFDGLSGTTLFGRPPSASEYTGVSILGHPPMGVLRTMGGEVRYVAKDLSHMQGVFDEMLDG